MNIRYLRTDRGAALHGILALAIVVSLFGWALSPFTSTATAQTTTETAPPLADVVATVSPAVVTVYNLTTAQGLLGNDEEPTEQGVGTGFIINAEGYIVTNWHVTTGGDSYAVQFADGSTVEAELIGEDPRDDLAVVRIAPESVPATVSFGDSDALRPGEPVFAIGSPLGQFANTVTEGIVSGLGRDQLGSNGLCQNYADLIQHDAAINPGNSGGPLFNAAGQVVGVNTLGIPSGANGVPLQGLFFAVPGNLVNEVAQQLIANGQISAPYLGVESQPLNPQLAAANDIPVDQGNYIQRVVEGTPAEEAGLQEGDVVTAVGDTEITTLRTLANILLDYAPGDQVTLTVQRGENEETINLTLGEAPVDILEACTLEVP